MTKRSKQTKSTIRKSLLTLLSRKNIEDITVTELCQSANIHRKTFYSYYHNTMDIIDELFDEFIHEISNIQIEMLLGTFTDFSQFFKYIDSFILKNINDYRLLSKTNQYIIFINRVEQYFSNKLFNTLPNYTDLFPNADKYTIYFLIYGIANLYMTYISDSSIGSIDQISSTCASLCERILLRKD